MTRLFSPGVVLANMHHYEDYDENSPKVFLGEYASWGNTYYNALVEAAYMTHLEQSKVVAMACYAPMLCNVDCLIADQFMAGKGYLPMLTEDLSCKFPDTAGKYRSKKCNGGSACRQDTDYRVK